MKGLCEDCTSSLFSPNLQRWMSGSNMRGDCYVREGSAKIIVDFAKSFARANMFGAILIDIM